MTTPAQRWNSLRTEKDSPGEAALTQQVAFDMSLPLPEREYAFAQQVGRRWRFDFAWPREGLAVEVEGSGPGGFGRHQRWDGFRRDAEKYNMASTLGWVVLRFTTEQVESMVAVDAIREFLHSGRKAAL